MDHNDYLDAHFKIFGLYGADAGGNCACGNPNCKAAFKHPKTNNWQNTPQWSDEQLEIMEEMGQFATGFGVLCDGHLIIDIDPRNGGKLEDFKDYYNQSGFVVATGGGGWHIYFSLPECAALVSHLPQYEGVDFKSSGFVVGAGSLHGSGAAYEAEKGHPCDITEAPAALLHLLEKKATHRGSVDGSAIDVTDAEIIDMLSCIDPDCDYETWYRCGMAVHHTTNGAAFDIWDQWSQRGSKYNTEEMDKKWHSFGKSANPVTLGTLLHYAKEGGYQEPVTFETDIDFSSESSPLDTTGVDILRPPGLAGQLTQWINDQCRYPREHLASACAIATVGNLGGLKYIDQDYGVTSNQFFFCVSGSSTGKEAVQSAMFEAHRVAGMANSCHGTIKSEQEIIRNIIKAPAALYVIDEIGFLLSKITNASKKGGAAYLEGVIGTLMSIYSKANDYFLLSGDLKDTTKKLIQDELAAIRKAEAENERFDAARMNELEFLAETIDNGIKSPFLSMVGFTTPVTFNQVVDYQQATNGFVGRSVIIQEKDTNPKAKRGFKRSEMPMALGLALANIHQGSKRGCERVGIPTNEDAQDFLNEVEDYFYRYSEEQKLVGLEAVSRRAFELVLKVSLSLAIPEGVRTVEHVRWAFAFIKRDIEDKINLAAANIASEDKRQDEALMRRIINVLDTNHSETTGVIVNRCRPFEREIVEKALDHLKKNGVITQVESKKTRGRPSARWMLTEQRPH